MTSPRKLRWWLGEAVSRPGPAHSPSAAFTARRVLATTTDAGRRRRSGVPADNDWGDGASSLMTAPPGSGPDIGTSVPSTRLDHPMSSADGRCSEVAALSDVHSEGTEEVAMSIVRLLPAWLH